MFRRDVVKYTFGGLIGVGTSELLLRSVQGQIAIPAAVQDAMSRSSCQEEKRNVHLVPACSSTIGSASPMFPTRSGILSSFATKCDRTQVTAHNAVLLIRRSLSLSLCRHQCAFDKCQELSRIGWEGITPLEANVVTTQDKALSPELGTAQSGDPRYADAATQIELLHMARSLRAKADSFIDIEVGTILRFLDLGGTQRTITVQSKLLELKGALANGCGRKKSSCTITGWRARIYVHHPQE